MRFVGTFSVLNRDHLVYVAFRLSAKFIYFFLSVVILTMACLFVV